MSKEDEPVITNVNDIVRQRLEKDAVASVEKLVTTEQTQGIARDKDDLSRPITLGEARKLVAEINGSFEKIKEWVEQINGIITSQGNYIQAMEQRYKAQEMKVNEIVLNAERDKPLPVPNSPFNKPNSPFNK